MIELRRKRTIWDLDNEFRKRESFEVRSQKSETFRPLLRKDRAPARTGHPQGPGTRKDRAPASRPTNGEEMQIPRSLRELVMTSVAT